MFDEKFWLAVSFTIFFLLIWKKAWPKISQMLSQKSEAIALEIMRAKQLKNSAQDLLTKSEEALILAKQEAEKIILQANNEAKLIAQNSKQQLEKELEKLSNATIQRIKSEEEAAIRQLKTQLIEQAFAKFSSQINLNQQQQLDLSSKALNSIEACEFYR